MNEAQYNLLEIIHNILQLSAKAYSVYLRDGKTYQNACELKKHNTRLRDLLTEESKHLSKDLQNDARALIAHYDAWTEKWNELERKLQPAPGDLFVFENDHRFPRKAARNLEQEYQTLKEKI